MNRVLFLACLVSVVSAASIRGLEAPDAPPNGSMTGATGPGATGAAPPSPPPKIPKENPVIAAYKEKMDLYRERCDEAKALTFNASEALNISIATVQKHMSLASEEVKDAKKSEMEEGGETTLEALTESQKHASDAKHERKRLKALRDVLKTAEVHEAKVCEAYDNAVVEYEAARQKMWKDKKTIYDEIKVLVKRTKRWLVREMATARADAANASLAQANPSTPPLVITHKIVVLDRAIRATHATKLYFDALVKRFNKAEAEANAEHEKLWNKPMPEVVAKREQLAKAEEDAGPAWSNEYIEGLGKNMTEAIGQAEDQRELVANITGETYVDTRPVDAPEADAGASGASSSSGESGAAEEAPAEEMRFLRVSSTVENNSSAATGGVPSDFVKLLHAVASKVGVPIPGSSGPMDATGTNNATNVTDSSGSSGSSGPSEMGLPEVVTHSFTNENGETVTTSTSFHKMGEKKKKALWEKVKDVEERKEGSAAGSSGASGPSGSSGPEGKKKRKPAVDEIARLASMENVIYGQVNAARKKEIRDERMKKKLMKKISHLEAELLAAKQPKDPVSMIKKIHMLASGSAEKKNKTTVPISDELREAAEGALDPEDAVSLNAIALKLEGGSKPSGPSGASGSSAPAASGPTDKEELDGIVSRLKALPGDETKKIANWAERLGSLLASPSGSEMMGPDAQKRDTGGDKNIAKADMNDLTSISNKLANLLDPDASGSSGSSGASGVSGTAESEDPLADVTDDESGASGAEEADEQDGVDAAKDELLKKRVKKLEEQLKAIGGDVDGDASGSGSGSGSDDGSGSEDRKEDEERKEETEVTLKNDDSSSGASGPQNGEAEKPKVAPVEKGKEKEGYKKVDQVGRGDLETMINHFPKKDSEMDASGAGPLRENVGRVGSQPEDPKIVPSLATTPAKLSTVITKTMNVV